MSTATKSKNSASKVTPETVLFCHYGTGAHADSPVYFKLPSHLKKNRMGIVVKQEIAELIVNLYELALEAEDWDFIRNFKSFLRDYKRGDRHAFSELASYGRRLGYFPAETAYPKVKSFEDTMADNIGWMIAAREHPIDFYGNRIGEISWHESRRWMPKRIARTLGVYVAMAAVSLGFIAVNGGVDKDWFSVIVPALIAAASTRLYTPLYRFRSLNSFHDEAMRGTPHKAALLKLLKKADTTDKDVFTFAVESMRDHQEKLEQDAMREKIVAEMWPVSEEIKKIEAEIDELNRNAFYYQPLISDVDHSVRSDFLEAQRIVLEELQERARELTQD